MFIQKERTAGAKLEPCKSQLGSAHNRTKTTKTKYLLGTGYVPRARRFDNCLLYISSFNLQNNPVQVAVIITTSILQMRKPRLRENVFKVYDLAQSQNLGPGLSDPRALPHHHHTVLAPYWSLGFLVYKSQGQTRLGWEGVGEGPAVPRS